jgi:MFS family permease
VAGGIFPLSFSIVRDEFPADRVAGSIGLMSAILGVRSPAPLVDMTMMRVRGVWTTNLAAFLLGGGLYAWFLLVPQFAQLPASTGFGYGASVVTAGLYLLPCAIGMGVLGSVAGRVERRFTSRRALIAGAAVSAVACGWLTFNSRHPYDMLISSALLGVGIGLAFAALGNLIVQAVPSSQTGVASGMNTVLRTLGGALGGGIAATFVAGDMVRGLPARPGSAGRSRWPPSSWSAAWWRACSSRPRRRPQSACSRRPAPKRASSGSEVGGPGR